MRVIVLNQSEPLRQVVEFITERGVDVDVVAETANTTNLQSLMEKKRPDYLFLLQKDYDQLPDGLMQFLGNQARLGVALISEEGQEVQLQVGQSATTAGVTGHELDNDRSSTTREVPAIPHSPDKDPHKEQEAASSKSAAAQPGTATLPSPAWRTYTLSDFIYLMTEDQPATPPSGGITDVPHHN